MFKNDLSCKDGLKKNAIDKEVFDQEIALCRKLTIEKSGGCGWGKCADCGVVPLLFKLHKGELLEDNEVKKKKKEILNA